MSPSNTYCSSNTSESVLPGGWDQLTWFILHHRMSQPLPLQTIICKPEDECNYQHLQHLQAEYIWQILWWDRFHFFTCSCFLARECVSYLDLSEIHSSLTSSFSLGSTLITSPPLVLTTMLLPTASNTSIDSVFLQRQQKLHLINNSDTQMNSWRNVSSNNILWHYMMS